MTCSTCNHALHNPGQCAACNCGESSLSHPAMRSKPTATAIQLPGQIASTLTARGYNCGHRAPKRRTDNRDE